MSDLLCTCPCRKAGLVLREPPVARFICHCRICQAVYRAAFADVTVVRRSSLRAGETHNVKFRKYRSPPALSRGTCRDCGSPVLALQALPRWAYIPAQNYPPAALLPAPAMHIFYDARTTDCSDELPRYHGYLRSEIAVARLVLSTDRKLRRH
jgi:hypothetical protein